MIIDQLAASYKATFTEKPKFQAEIAEITVSGNKALLVKPTTFYNDSGASARSLVDFYKLSPENDLLVIHDDLALPFGTIRVRRRGSDAGNNGIKSLNAHIGENYTRLRIGIYTPERDTTDDVVFVLSRFNSTEIKALKDTIIPKNLDLADDFINNSLEETSYKVE